MGWNSTALWNQAGQSTGWNQVSGWNTAGQGGTAPTAPAITAVSSPRGADIASADETLTITLSDSAGVSAVTVNGAACSNVAIVDSTTVTALCPHGFGAPYGSAGDVVVSAGTATSAPYSVTLHPRSGTTQTQFTVDYAVLSADSPFAGDSAFSALVAGDSCIYDSVTTPDGIAVMMSGDGVFSLASTPTQDQSFQYSIFDASDNTDGPLGTVTVSAPVTVTVGAAYELDSGLPVSVPVVAAVTPATEQDQGQPIMLPVVASVGVATEVDAAQTIFGPVIATVGAATEVDTAAPLSVPVIATVAAAAEADTARPITVPVVATVTAAHETDQAGGLSQPVVVTLGTAVEADAALSLDAVLSLRPPPGVLSVSDAYIHLNTS